MTPHPPTGEPSDSAGVPWGGRSLPTGEFADDDGRADPAVVAAAAAGDEQALLDALAGSRVLVPVTAVAGAHDVAPANGLVSDTETDMALVLLHDPDGSVALPVFSSLATMAEYDRSLRPVPTPCDRAAASAIAESADVIVLDCASAHAVELRPSMVWALAQRRRWIPAHLDPFVHRAVEAACAPERAVAGVSCVGGPAGSPALVLQMRLHPGLSAPEVEGVVTAVGERLATDGEVRARIDALSFRVV